MTESSYMIAPGESATDIAMRRKLALALMQQGSDTSPVQHWTQGLARMGQGALGGYEAYSAEKSDKEETAKGNALLAQMLGNGPAASPSAGAAPMGQAAASEMPSASDASMPRGYRNMNPGNIEDGPFARSQPGYAGSDGRFAKFAAMENGTGAMDALLSSYEKRGINTPASIVNRWAPASDGNNVSAYAQNIAKQLGIDPTMPVPPEKRQALIAAMAQHENGQPLPQGQPQQMAQAQPQGAPPRELMIQMLGNRKTAPIAQGIISSQIQQRFKPSEYDFKERPDGTLVAVNKKNPSDIQVVNAPGSGQSAIDYEANKAAAIATAKGKAERELVAPEKNKNEQAVARVITEDIDRALKTIDTATLPTTGQAGSWLSNIGGTAANDVRALVDTVKANTGFQELNKMRSMSPTGGALGSITERELALLQSTVGNLEQSQSADQFKDNLRRVKNTYLDVIHGEGKGPPREKLKFQERAAPPDRSAIEAEMKRRGLLK